MIYKIYTESSGAGGGGGEDMSQYPLEFTGHYLIGGNPDDIEHGYWDTEQDAINAFAVQFEELAQKAQGKFLFVRAAPVCKKSAIFDSDEYKWRMIGRFSIAKLKENNNA